MMNEAPPDLVLLDVMMPNIDGLTVAERIRADARTQDIPVIMVSASHGDSNIERGFAAGIEDYLTKPVSRPLLLARMDSAFRARDARRAAARAKESQRGYDELVRDLEDARGVQRSLLPAMPARFGEWTATGALVPWGHVGGDAFDLLHGRDGWTIAVLIDVSGHGVAAALLAASVCSALRRLVQTESLVDCIAALDAQLNDGESGKYACLAAIALKGDDVVVVNAGLPPVVVIRRGQIVESVVATAAPLGLVPGGEVTTTQLQVQRGDRLVIVSDGLTEPFGLGDDLDACLASLQLLESDLALPPPATLGREIASLFGPGTPQSDDATLLVLERG
jgi:CheY-like chemotaxis protein